MSAKDKLIELYSIKSKHSNYQVLPTRLKEIIGAYEVNIRTRYEAERLRYMLQKLDVSEKTVLDIGANTGFFSFELLDADAKSVHYYEGNKEHAEFVSLAAQALEIGDKLRITNNYYTFNKPDSEHYDITLLLNVLHHIGDDYGDKDISIEKAKELILQQLDSLSKQTEVVVFQLGFNWQGNPTKRLFENGAKQEVIDYITEGVAEHWKVAAIGIPEQVKNGIVYADMNDSNIVRNDSLGEFLNRPLFILKSNF